MGSIAMFISLNHSPHHKIGLEGAAVFSPMGMGAGWDECTRPRVTRGMFVPVNAVVGSRLTGAGLAGPLVSAKGLLYIIGFTRVL